MKIVKCFVKKELRSNCKFIKIDNTNKVCLMYNELSKILALRA